jgi:hypothetical protein
MDVHPLVLFALFAIVALVVAYATNPRPDEAERLVRDSVWAQPDATVRQPVARVLLPAGVRRKDSALSVETTEQEVGGNYPRTYTRIAVHGLDIVKALCLETRSWVDSRSIRTGDPAFDARLVLSGPPLVSAAVLDGSTRAALLNLLVDDARVTLKRGTLELVLCGSMSALAAKLPVGVQLCLEAARGLCLAPIHLSEALVANAEGDPCPGVRAQNLEMLALHFPETEATRRAAAAACADEDPRVRFAGARLVAGPKAYACLVSLVEGPAAVPAALKACALRHLVDTYVQLDLSRYLSSALTSDSGPVQLAAAEAAALRPHSARLRQRLTGANCDPVMAARSEWALTALLLHLDPAARVAAARALGAVGTLRSVEPLTAVARRLLQGGEVRRAAREAVREIQERHSAGDEGGLSLAAPESLTGALSTSKAGAL